MPTSLRDLPVFEIGSYELAESILQFSDVAEECLSALKEMCQFLAISVTPDAKTHFDDLTGLARTALEQYEQAAKALESDSTKLD
jgi:hypothetical protein